MGQTQLITHKINKRIRNPINSAALCRQLLFRILKNVTKGELIIHDDRGSYHFGQTSELRAVIHVDNFAFYQRIITGGSIGAGESYIEGWWSSDDVTKVIEFFSANTELLDSVEEAVAPLFTFAGKIKRIFQKNDRKKAKKNIVAHYDLGDELYSRFLDKTMMYSSAMYTNEACDLHSASLNKLKSICEKLNLKSTDHLLEIGTGWGGLAVYAAKHYDCKVTTTTISEEQYRHVELLIESEGLQDRITLLKEDYRDLTGQYDKLVSVEMIEAVGHEYFQTFFRKCESLTRKGGRIVIQSILIDDSRYDNYRKNEDFIQKYIFPGGALPSKNVVYDHVTRLDNCSIVDYENFGYDYARTLNDWRHSFNKNWPEIEPFGFDERFKRLWNFYFHYCEGAFLQKQIDVAHFVITRHA